jgi:DNA-directed RNA polymerase specialized sigma24 family protein
VPIGVADRPSAAWAAALALLASHGSAFQRTARRHSLCADDADDAYARSIEILFAKGPFDEPARLVGWMQVVTKREAMRVRRSRERLLGGRVETAGAELGALELASPGPGPAERAERRERIAHSAAALAALKPQERRALALKAEGYSYAEIQSITGWTYTKVNRCMAEGRKSFLENFARIAGEGG